MPEAIEQKNEIQARLKEKVSNIFLTLTAIFENPTCVEEMDEPTLKEFIKNGLTWQETLAQVAGTALAHARAEYQKRLVALAIEAVPDREWIIKLEDEYTPYVPDKMLLEEIAQHPALTPEEQAKLGRIVPEEIVPAHFEPGATVSILAIADRYANHPIGDAITAAMRRNHKGKGLVFKRRPAPKKKLTRLQPPAA